MGVLWNAVLHVVYELKIWTKPPDELCHIVLRLGKFGLAADSHPAQAVAPVAQGWSVCMSSMGAEYGAVASD